MPKNEIPQGLEKRMNLLDRLVSSAYNRFLVRETYPLTQEGHLYAYTLNRAVFETMTNLRINPARIINTLIKQTSVDPKEVLEYCDYSDDPKKIASVIVFFELKRKHPEIEEIEKQRFAKGLYEPQKSNS